MKTETIQQELFETTKFVIMFEAVIENECIYQKPDVKCYGKPLTYIKR